MKKNFTNALIVLLAIISCGFSLKAEEYPTNILSVPSSVDVNADGVAIIPISLNNTVGVEGLQVTLTGEGLSFGQIEWTSRVDCAIIKDFQANTLVLACSDSDPILPLNEGEDAVIAKIPVTINEGQTAQSISVSLKGNYTPVNSNYTDVRLTTVYTTVNVVKTYPIDVPASVNYIVDKPAKVSVGLNNDFVAGAITVRFTLPAGVELNSDVAVRGARVTSGTSISKIVKGNGDVYSVNLMNFTGSTLNGNSGEILSFEIVANELLAEDAEINWDGTEISTIDAELFMGVAQPTLLVENSAAITLAYNNDVERMNELAQAFQQFVDETSETFPGYLVLKKEEVGAVSAMIQAISDKIVAAIETAEETGVYDGPATGEFTAANEALMALVAGLEETTLAIQEAYDADVAAVNELATAMQEFNTSVAETFPGYAVLKAEEIAALTATIEELNSKVNVAMEAAYETGVYEGPTGAEITAANEALIALVAGMEETIQAIQEAYDADVAAVNELATAMQEFNTSVAETFPGYAVLKAEEIAALTATIEELNSKVNAAMEAAYETGVYEGPTGAEITAANEAFLALMAGVEELTANVQAAYDADIAAINELANAMQEFNNQVEEEFPGYANLKAEEIAALTATIEALNQKVTDAWEAVYETGVYEGLSGSDIAPANEALMALVAGMEEALNAINEDYENAVALVNEYTLNVQDLYNQIDEEFPAYWNENEAELIALNQNAVALSQACETALGEALQTTGEYVAPSDIRTANAELLAIIEAYNEAYAAIENAAMADAEKLAEYAAEVLPFTEDYDAANWDDACILYQYIANIFELVGAAQTEALTETAVYVSPLTDEVLVHIEDGISALKKTDSINGIANDNNDVRYFDLNGQAVKEPVAGKVYIRISNGKTSKVLVK